MFDLLLFQEKYPSKSHSGGGGSYYDRYGDRSSKESPSYNRLRDDSPGRPSPRYQNKSSYKDRAKERIDKGKLLHFYFNQHHLTRIDKVIKSMGMHFCCVTHIYISK